MVIIVGALCDCRSVIWSRRLGLSSCFTSPASLVQTLPIRAWYLWVYHRCGTCGTGPFVMSRASHLGLGAWDSSHSRYSGRFIQIPCMENVCLASVLRKKKKMYKKKACSKHSKASNRPSLRLDCHCTLTLITDSLSSPVPPLSAGNTMKTRFKALFACVALISSGSILTLLHPSPHALPSFANLVSLGTTFDADRAETLQLLSQLYEGERMFLLADYDQTAEEQIIRSPPGALDPDFDRYIARLESFVDTYFSRSIFHRPLSTSLERMIDGRPPLAQGSSGGGSFTQRIYSFDKGGPGGAPREFGWWRKRLGEEWVIEVGDDVRMEGWFDEMVGMETIVPDLPGQEGESVGTDTVGTGKSTWEELWFGLGRPVLKSDILRYLLMLLRGGMYTDSDTAVSCFLDGMSAKVGAECRSCLTRIYGEHTRLIIPLAVSLLCNGQCSISTRTHCRPEPSRRRRTSWGRLTRTND